MKLEGKKLYYREITEADTDMVLKWRNSDYVRNHFLHREMISRKEHLQWLHEQVMTGKVIQFIMIERITELPIGSVYLRDVDNQEKTAEYGIFIGEASSRGKGYGTEAAQMMLFYAFQQMQLRRLTLRVLADNVQAIRSYERAGFCLELGNEEQMQINGKEEKILFMSAFAGEESDE